LQDQNEPEECCTNY